MGIKVFVLADAHNGYIKKNQVYTGKGIESRRANDIVLCTKVVLELMEKFDGSGLHLYIDNYYTGPTLYQHLYKHGINACGTSSSSRRGFPVLEPTELNRGKFQLSSNSPLLATSWVDKRTINFCSTIHMGELSSGYCTATRREKNGSKVERQCPPLLLDYQKVMRGVHRGDQLQCYYNMGRRSRK